MARDDVVHNEKSQAGSDILCLDSIGCAEKRRKKMHLLFFRDSDAGITHGELKYPLRNTRKRDSYLATRRSIGNRIRNEMLRCDSKREGASPHQKTLTRRDVENESYPFPFSQGMQSLHRLFHDAVKRHRPCIIGEKVSRPKRRGIEEVGDDHAEVHRVFFDSFE